jgi:putative hydrolase of the HAD superfamily
LTAPNTNQIEAVLFDYGQVLSNPPDPAAWARMIALTGLDEPALHTAYWAHRRDYDRGALTGPAYWSLVIGASLNPTQIAALNAADTDLWTSLNLPMVDWAARLQAAGIRTGILSNIGDSIAEGITAKLLWLSAFDHRTWSHELLLAKPDPAIYLATAESLRTPPANILFIDDREDNIAAAAALGFQTIHYTTHPVFEQEMRARGLASLLDISAPVATPRQ